MHLDFNSFFASVEQQANPFLREKPIAVAGKGKESIDIAQAQRGDQRVRIGDLKFRRSVITTASREAKKLGVKTAMATWEALKICPELTVIPGDPKKYSEITNRFVAILRRYGDKVQLFSADEAFIDVTNAAADWMGATLLAQRIRDDIRRECGSSCTVSIGIAPNKLVAKLASETVKPSGLTCVPPEQVADFVLNHPLEDVCGIGPRIARRLAGLGITSMATLRKATLHTLTEALKPSYGAFLYYASRGMGDDTVVDEEAPPKSIGHSYTFPHNLLTENDVRNSLLTLCDRVAVRMRKQKVIATHLSVYARYADFSSMGTGKQFREPFIDGLAIFKAAWALIRNDINLEKGVRLLGISASSLHEAPMPRPIFPKDERMNSALQSLDKLTDRYGIGIWQRGSTMNTVLKERVSGWHYDHELV